MVSNIQKEKIKKQTRLIYIIMGIIIYVFYAFFLFHYSQIKLEYPRYDIAQKLNMAMEHISTNPAEISLSAIKESLKTLLLTSGLGATFLILFITNISLKKHDNPDTVNGEAKLMDSEDLKRYNMRRTDPFNKPTSDGPKNMILSEEIKLAIDNRHTRRNCNTLVIGGSGAGKSRFFVSPNILQYNSNFVITDPSGELLRDYGKALEDNGYQVKVFNLTDVYKSSRYNPFHYINSEKDIFVLVNTLIKNTNPEGGGKGDPFWENSEKLLITALMLYLWHTAPKKDQNFSKLVQMVGMANIDENDESAQSPLDLLFEDLAKDDPENLAVLQYRKFKLGAGKTLKSILISVGVRLQTFELSDIKYLTNDDTLQLESFADTKQALFVVIPTADTTFNFLVSMMYSQLFSSLYTYCETRAEYGYMAYLDDLNIIKVEQATKDTSQEAKTKIEQFITEVKNGTHAKFDDVKKLYYIYTQSGSLVGWRGTKEAANTFMNSLKNIKIRKCEARCPYHVRLLLDEFANIGQIPDFDQKLATIRKYEISCAIILQAISQLKEIYDKKWNTIAGNCDTKLFLGCDDEETIKWLVGKMGKKTTIVENTSWSSKGQGNMSLNRSSIDLITVDQVANMDDNECIVTIRGEHPYFGKKYELTKHPNYKYAKETSGQFFLPMKTVEKKNNTPLRENIESSFYENDNNGNDNVVPNKDSNKPNTKLSKEAHTKANKSKADKMVEALNKQTQEENRIKESKNNGFYDNAAVIASSLGFAPGSIQNMDDEQLLEEIESKVIIETITTEDLNYSQTY
ncbi:Type IV secretory system Conjugative DNA transfer [Lachnospira multipara]|uniref:Type IV secretory system Conjugative DNA transfer n=2 Tax=Lachnospira multipara TaxID=28051 RepID=A0A1H5WW60_9FIRM|nr:type IV secretory system conjugative DNA transfer family protein [Lachnospira multipara]SEG03525.1 Type IV secretory system Conjugative DNA transfer [Lachnospira multipara]